MLSILRSPACIIAFILSYRHYLILSHLGSGILRSQEHLEHLTAPTSPCASPQTSTPPTIIATMAQPARLRSLYRALLRELPPRPPSSTASRSPLHHQLRQSFSMDSSQENAISQAEQLIQYLKAQRQYTTLLERYNPGMNMEEEERIRLSARRVGMDLPTEYGRNQA